VTTIALREEEMSVVCTPDHPLAGADAIHAGDLQGYDMIGFDQDLPVGRRVVAYLREHGVTPSFINTFDNLDTLKTAVMDTQRATILPRRTVRREAEAGSLHVLTLTPTLRRPIGLIHRSGVKMRGRSRPGDTGLSPIATQFIDDLLAFARAEDQRSAASNGRRSTTSPTPDRFAAILAGADS
jgi:DNA-binding transcriptional LysR family regulator